MLEKFQLRANATSVSDPSAVPGYSACLSEPASRRPTVGTKSHTGLRFRKGDEDPVPHEDDLASASHIDETPETGILQGIPESLRVASGLRVLLGNAKPVLAPGFSGVSQSRAGLDIHHELVIYCFN